VTSSTQNYDVLLHTDFPGLELFASGKVRDLYLVDNNHLLFVATDRISAFDYVLATGIPQKGRVLTQLSLFWFDFLKTSFPTTWRPPMCTSIRRSCRNMPPNCAAAPCW
jgi:phosphoribosylaminoimidazole-succinocarboxamide synthase